MNFLEISAIMNVIRKSADFKNWLRHKLRKNNSTGNLESTNIMASSAKKGPQKRLSAVILPQKFDLVGLDSGGVKQNS